MRAALERAKRSGVAVGAHPGYDDRDRFGREETGASPEAIGELVERQVAALAEQAEKVGLPLAHVKPHGALYHRVGGDREAADALVATAQRVDPGLAILAAPGSQLLAAAAASGLPAIAEGFVDRRYATGGGLVPRASGGAGSTRGFLLKGKEAVEQALRLAQGEAPDFGSFPFTGKEGGGEHRSSIGGTPSQALDRGGAKIGSLCLHSDSPGTAELARAVRCALEGAGFVVRPFAGAERVPAIPEVRVVGAAIVEGGRVLLTRRSPRMSMPGKWEFPGGKVEGVDGSLRAALEREIREELGVAVEVGERIGRGTSLEAGRRIVLEVYLARRGAGEFRLVEHEELGWFAAGELSGLDWPEADLPILPALARLLDAAR